MDTLVQNKTKPSSGIRSASISRLLMLSFIIVALLPVGLLSIKLYSVAWENAWREITEKHQLLAQNLAAPLAIYVNDHRDSLGLMSDFLAQMINNDLTDDMRQLQHQEFIRSAMDRLQGFRSLSLVNKQGVIEISTVTSSPSKDQVLVFENENCFINTRSTGQWTLSGIKPSPFTAEPTLIMSQPIYDRQGKLSHVLMGELRIDLVEKLRKKIRFGILGHSAIVDKRGYVIAHPNPDWMKEMKDISKIPVVQSMMAGETGVTEFYSPFLKAMMVAGYASVPEIGWGIMVPQPKPEVEAHVNRLLFTQLAWGAFGLVLAVLLAFVLMRWIIGPLNRLCASATDLMDKGFEGKLSDVSKHSPSEIRHLNNTFSNLVNGLQGSRREFKQLNASLQSKVEEATSDLRDAYDSMKLQASLDYLTRLANRRHFEEVFAKSLKRKRHGDECVCLMLIDVDHFKPINDQYGHATGDSILVQLAELLEENIRKEDLAARYAGDEFVIIMHCSRAQAEEQANKLLRIIEHHPFAWVGIDLDITVSIGLLCQQRAIEINMDVMLETVDQALYRAKENGRNQAFTVGI